MSALLEILAGQMDAGRLSQIAGAVGASPDQASRAVEAALPALIGGLARNASKPDGASALAGALERDHDGSLLDDVGGLISMFGGGGGGKSGGMLGGLLGAAGSLLGGRRQAQAPRAANGAGILKHVFGGQQGSVEQAIGKASGLDAGSAGKLLAMLAPMVMGALGRVKKQQNMDAGALAGMLSNERQDLESRTEGLGGLMGMLDADGDGDLTDDVAKLGAGLLGQFLKR